MNGSAIHEDEVDLWNEWAGCRVAVCDIESDYDEYLRECRDDEVEPNEKVILSMTCAHPHFVARYRAVDAKLTDEQRRRFEGALQGMSI